MTDLLGPEPWRDKSLSRRTGGKQSGARPMGGCDVRRLRSARALRDVGSLAIEDDEFASLW
jgi:hypothetical protein